MNVSLICACKNRERALRVSLASWILVDEIKEIIIVDWSSDRPLNDLTKIDKRIKVIRVNDEKYFNQPQPLNLAASIATGDHILKVDCDYLFNPYYNFFESYKIDNNSFVCGQNNIYCPEFWNEEIQGYCVDLRSMSLEQLTNYCNAYSAFFKYLTGLLYIERSNFYKVGGYNENMGKYYAFEDDEIVSRLELMGLENKKIEFDHRLIHIPHPDKKRYENFESFYEESAEVIEEVKQCLVDQGLDDTDRWNLEYLLAKRQVEENKKIFSEITDYYVDRIYEWDVQQMDDQNYFAYRKNNKNKLDGLNTVNYVTLEESVDRQKKLNDEFKKFGIENINPIISKRFSESEDIITGKYSHTLNDGTKGCCVSHLKAIQSWYNNTSEEYGFFCEDDLSLETVEYWNFTWNEFVKNLPDDWECVQLMCIRGEFDNIKLRDRYWDDWSATAYILKRNYAKKIIDNYIIDNTYHLELKNCDIQPLIENILFTNLGKTYTIPMFVEDINFQSTFEGDDDDVKDGQKRNHYFTYETVLNWWKEIGHEKTIQEIIGSTEMTRSFKIEKSEEKAIDPSKTELESLLTEFSLDTENDENNFKLGLWYETNGHTAPALSYYLRCAERTQNNDLAYESLIRGSYCYEKQGTRDMTSKALLQQALVLMPNRPEAYFLLSRYAERRQWWQDAYIYADIAIRTCDFDCKPLRTNVEYPGKYGLLFEKHLAAWWWGKGDEARALLQEMKNNYDLSPEYYSSVQNNLMQMGSGHIPEEVIKYQKSKHDKLRFKFEGSEDIENNYSQAYQDMFILAATKGKRNGLYLEIGAQQPFYQNNTALLETKYGWNGISIEIVKELCEQFARERNNKIICENATKIDYLKLLDGFDKGTDFDYLQLDVEPSKVTFECLLAIPFEKYRFGIITYEHDHYVDMTSSYRDKSRRYLKLMGYELLVANVSPNDNSPFEDWWYHPDLIDPEIVQRMKCVSDDPVNIVKYMIG